MTDEFFIRALIYGQPGLGKSTLAISSKNPLMIDTDGGAHRIAPQHRVPCVPVQSYDDVLGVLAEDLSAFDTIVIDTCGKLLDYMSIWLIAKNPKLGQTSGALTMQGYGQRKQTFRALLKQVSTMGKHLIFVAHEVEEKSGDTRVIRPEVGASSGADLIKELDLVGYMEAIGRKRTVSFSPSDKYYAKNSARFQDVMDVPHLEAGTPNEFMSTILDQCLESINAESERVAEYNALIATASEIVATVKDGKTTNAALKKIAGLDHFWDSKARTWQALREAATGKGLTFASGKFSKKEQADDSPDQSDAA